MVFYNHSCPAMKRLFLGSIIVFCTAITSCDFKDSKLVVHNNTDSAIAFIIPQEKDQFPTTSQQDSIAGKERNDSMLDKTISMAGAYDQQGVHFVKANSSRPIGVFNTTWESVIKESPKQKLEFLFFPSKIFTSGLYTWRQICSMYSQKKVFTKADLEKANWVVNFDKK